MFFPHSSGLPGLPLRARKRALRGKASPPLHLAEIAFFWCVLHQGVVVLYHPAVPVHENPMNRGWRPVFRLPSTKPRQIVDGAVPTPVHVHMPFCGRQQRWPGSISWRAALSAESCRTYGVRCIIVPARLPGLRQSLRSAGDAPHLPGASAMFTGVALSPVEFPGVFPHLSGLPGLPLRARKRALMGNPVRPCVGLWRCSPDACFIEVLSAVSSGCCRP